jgi:hypothetical protein
VPTQLELRQSKHEFYGRGLRAASITKGVTLTENEMERVRAEMDAGKTPEEIGKEFTPPLPPREQSYQGMLAAFARQIAGLTEDMNAQGLVIRQLEEEVGKLHEEIAALTRATAPASAKKHA